MYSRITKIYYRRMKPVQIEGTTETFFPQYVVFHCSSYQLLLLGIASVCSEKMAAPGEKSFWVLEYHTSKSVVTVQCAFRAKYAKDPIAR